jgi:hypothetical protein
MAELALGGRERRGGLNHRARLSQRPASDKSHARRHSRRKAGEALRGGGDPPRRGRGGGLRRCAAETPQEMGRAKTVWLSQGLAPCSRLRIPLSSGQLSTPSQTERPGPLHRPGPAKKRLRLSVGGVSVKLQASTPGPRPAAIMAPAGAASRRRAGRGPSRRDGRRPRWDSVCFYCGVTARVRISPNSLRNFCHEPPPSALT